MDENILTGPAVVLACELEAAGFEMRAMDDQLQVRPRDAITFDLAQRIRAHKHELLLLLRVLDDEVIRRRDAFKCQWLCRSPRDPIGPQFVLRAEIPYVRGLCFSCGDSNGDTWGRCWRCRLAWRLAVGLPIAADRAVIETDSARVCA